MTDLERIDYILSLIQKLNDFINGADEEMFFNDDKLKFACYGCLVMISEGAGKLSIEIKEKAKNFKWAMLKGFRNRIIHEYFNIDWSTMWDIIHYDILELGRELEAISNF